MPDVAINVIWPPNGSADGATPTVVIGITKGFHGEKYIRHRVERYSTYGTHPSCLHLCDSLEETCRLTMQLLADR